MIYVPKRPTETAEAPMIRWSRLLHNCQAKHKLRHGDGCRHVARVTNMDPKRATSRIFTLKNMEWLRRLKRELGSQCHGRRFRPMEMGAGSGTVCWHRMGESGTGSGSVAGKDGRDDKVGKTENGWSQVLSHWMTHPLQAFVLKQQHVASTSTWVHGKQQWHKRLGGGGTAQHVEQAVGAARIQPSDTAGGIRLGTMQGGTVMSLRVGRYLSVHGWSSREATAIRPKHNVSCLLCVRESNGGNLAWEAAVTLHWRTQDKIRLYCWSWRIYENPTGRSSLTDIMQITLQEKVRIH